MSRLLLFIYVVVCLIGCTCHVERCYLTDPKSLQRALNQCSVNESSSSDCQAAEALANEMNQLVNELKSGPERFGLKIMDIQENIASKEKQLTTEKDNKTLQQALIDEKNELSRRLAVIRWLESPGE